MGDIKRIAHIENGEVVNISLSDGETPLSYPHLTIELPEGSEVDIGWEYIEGELVDNRPKPDWTLEDWNPETGEPEPEPEYLPIGVDDPETKESIEDDGETPAEHTELEEN